MLSRKFLQKTVSRQSTFPLYPVRYLSSGKGGDDDDDDSKKPETKFRLTKDNVNIADLYKDNQKTMHTPPCPNCGSPGHRLNANINSRFFICSKCSSTYLTLTPKEQAIADNQQNIEKRKEERENELNEFVKKNREDLPPNPRLITQYLDQYVIGQEHAKKVLSVATYANEIKIIKFKIKTYNSRVTRFFYNHYKRVRQNFFIQLEENGMDQIFDEPQRDPQHAAEMTPIKLMSYHTSPISRKDLDGQFPALKQFAINELNRGKQQDSNFKFDHILALSGKELKAKLEREIKQGKFTLKTQKYKS